MKTHLRKIHIDDQEWKWVVEDYRGYLTKEVRIYSPEKKMWRVKPEDISHSNLNSDETPIPVSPSMVKDYIIKNLLQQ